VIAFIIPGPVGFGLLMALGFDEGSKLCDLLYWMAANNAAAGLEFVMLICPFPGAPMISCR
jgi:hypothetical protein